MKQQVGNILNFWEKTGSSKPAGELVTHRDVNQVSLEIKTVLDLLDKRDIVLDVGCGNGFASSVYAKKCRRLTGVDYSVNMVESALKAYARKNLTFFQADVLSPNVIKGSYSTVITTRCLINLLNWKFQKKAIQNIHRMLGKNGKFIFIEGIRQGRDNLNKLRNELGLSSLPKVWYNRDFDYDKLMLFLKDLFYVRKEIRFGLYDVLTRAYYPASIYPKEPCYNSSYHRCAEKLYLESKRDLFDDCSRELCLELIKK